MPITIRWYDETKRIVLWEFEGKWTLDDFHAIHTRSHNLCMEVPHQPVIALIDMTRAHHSVPGNIFTSISARGRGKAPNFDMAVVVSHSTLIKVFISTMNKLPSMENQFAFFDSHNAALSFIHQRWEKRKTA